MLWNGEPREASTAISALSEFGPAARSAVPTLVEAVRGPEEVRRIRGAVALAYVHPLLAVEAVPVLADALHHQRADLRLEATLALGNLGASAHASPAVSGDWTCPRDLGSEEHRRSGEPESG